MAGRRGIAGQTRRGTTTDLATDINSGQLVIASVTACFRGGHPDAAGGVNQRGGHLVLVTGAATDTAGTPTSLRVHHPSATRENNWPNRWVDNDTFMASFSGAYMLFQP